MTQPLSYRINEVCKMLPVSRATVYRLVKAGNLKLVKLSDTPKGASGITAESLEQHLRRIGAA
jgi:predicted site-specific integrase-resolvase